MHPVIKSMMNNGLGNYITPGLHSYLIGGEGFGKTRIFVADRQTRDTITPHSHRFSFVCLVLEGVVWNTVYQKVLSENSIHESTCARWLKSTITQVCGANGVMEFTHNREAVPDWYKTTSHRYDKGSWYSMVKDDIHSITFSRGAEVLFFEGPEEQNYDYMLEPWVNGKLVPTFKVESWMFEKMP